jgi:K+-sensing histidine kinase KdpD
VSKRLDPKKSQENQFSWAREKFGHPKEHLETLNKLAHSLRSPLNSILGYTQILLERLPGEINDIQARYLANINENGILLLQTVNEIIFWLQSGTKTQGFLRTRFHLDKIVEQVCRTPSSLIQIKNLKIIVNEEKNPVQVWGDQRVVEEIILNILHVLAQIATNRSEILVDVEESKEYAEIHFSCPQISVIGKELEQTIRNALDSETSQGFARSTAGGQIQVDLKTNESIKIILAIPLAKREHFTV